MFFKYNYVRKNLFPFIFLFVIIFTALTAVMVAKPNKALADDAWWNASWGKRIKITLDNSTRAENLTDFPIAVYLNSTRVTYADFTTGGYDMRFVDANGSTVLNYEIEKWNTSGTSTAWVKIPQIDASSATDYVYLYYNNTSATTAPITASTTGVWDSSYISVLHLGDNPSVSSGPQMQDSTANNLDASSTALTATSTGVVGDALDMNGTTQYVQYASTTLPIGLSAGTVEIWFDPDTFGADTNGRYLVTKDKAGTNVGEWRLFLSSEGGAGQGRLSFRIECPSAINVTAAADPSLTGGWYYATAVLDKNGGAGNMKLYQNGTATGTPATATCGMDVTGEKPEIGRNNGKATPDGYFDGKMDEFRISSSTRSANWINATYSSISDTLASFGVSGALPGAPTSLTALVHSTKIGLSWTSPGGSITDYVIEYKLSSEPTIWTTFSDTVISTASTTVTGLTNDSAYNFRVSAVNANGTGTPSSTVSATPTQVMTFISPTISDSVSTTSTSITAYASTTLTSSHQYYTFRLETSGGSLVSQATTSTRYGNYSLANLSEITHRENLALTVTDLSGQVYVSTTDTLFTVHNNQNKITEVTRAGVTIRTITCTSCGDIEDITLVSSVASSTVGGYDHTFMISTEDVNIANLQIFRVIIHSTGTLTVNRDDYYSTGIAAATTNDGLEGIAYNSNTGTYFVSVEGQATQSTRPRIYEVTLGSGHSSTASEVCSNVNVRDYLTEDNTAAYGNTTYADISGLDYIPSVDRLYVISHKGDEIIEMNVTNRSSCTVLNALEIAMRADSGSNHDYEMPEGVSWDNTGDYMYVSAESDYWSVWRTGSYGVRNTFSGLADGTYNLYVSVTDVNGITSTSSARAFTVNTDVTAPTISSVASSTSYTTATVTWTTNESSNSKVSYGTVSGTYTTSTTSSSMVTSHSIGLTSLSEGTRYYFVVVSADVAGNIATSSEYSLLTDTSDSTGPAISSISSSVTSSSATITWTTDELASSQVGYGVSSIYGASTTVTDTSPRVTSHSISLTDLTSCTKYYFRIISTDASSNTTYSSGTSFTTSGCTGDATVEAVAVADVVVADGGTNTVTSGDQSLQITIPANVTSDSSNLVFQSRILTDTSVIVSAGSPTGMTVATGQVYDLKAYVDATNTLAIFNSALTITISYSDSDISSLNESSLTIYRYDGSSWVALTGCTVNTTANTITCTTTHFSVFGLFGTTRSSNSTSGGHSVVSGSRPFAYLQNQQSSIVTLKVIGLPPITKPLSKGMTNADVLTLQKILNSDIDTTITTTGGGSKGHETYFFGALTKSAVIKFQIKYRIIKSANDPFAGFVGPNTRAKLNILGFSGK